MRWRSILPTSVSRGVQGAVRGTRHGEQGAAGPCVVITRGRQVQRGSSGWPKIDVDANNFIHIQSRASVDPVAHAAAALKEWSKLGLVITPVCDGDTRPQSKQQSNLNRARREKSRCNAILAQQKL